MVWVDSATPNIVCVGLPWCSSDWGDAEPFIATIIANVIQYIAVIAVIALMISGIMYIVSSWEEEKTKRAKNWIIWSLVWVFLSISASGIIGLVNTLWNSWEQLTSVDGALGFVKDSIFDILGLIAIWMFLIIGMRLVIARGNPEEFKKALLSAVYAVVWIAVVALAYAVVVLVSGVTL